MSDTPSGRRAPPLPRVRLNCPGCGRAFEEKASQVRLRGRTHCSRACELKTRTRKLADRFWPKVQKTAGCWLWTGSVDANGYGRICRARSVPALAHRVSWELAHGPAPATAKVLHNCPGGDNPRCVNPAHLWLGTQRQNVADMVAKGRTRKGEAKKIARLTEAKVREVRRRYAAGAVTMARLATDMSVSPGVIFDVIHFKTWKHVV